MGALDYRITDTQVRRDDALVKIAKEFIQKYDGEFEPLLLVQHALHLNGELTIVQARLVLNCLRQEADPFWGPLQRQLAFALEVPDQVSVPKLKIVKPKPEREPRVWEVRVPAKLHGDMVTPKPRNGSIHATTHGEVWWKLGRDYWGRIKIAEHANRIPQLVVYTVCGNSYYNPLVVKDETEYPDRNFCKSGCWEDD